MMGRMKAKKKNISKKGKNLDCTGAALLFEHDSARRNKGFI